MKPSAPGRGVIRAALRFFAPAPGRARYRSLNARLKRRQVRRSVYPAMKFVACDG